MIRKLKVFELPTNSISGNKEAVWDQQYRLSKQKEHFRSYQLETYAPDFLFDQHNQFWQKTTVVISLVEVSEMICALFCLSQLCWTLGNDNDICAFFPRTQFPQITNG